MNSQRTPSFKLCALIPGIPLTGPAWAQITVNGRVIQQGASNGIPEVPVFLQRNGPDFKPEPWTTTTGPNGEFHFEVDSGTSFVIRTEKPGYTNAATNLRPADQMPAIPDPNFHSLDEPVILEITPRPKITGRIVDFDTEEPVEGVQVALAGVVEVTPRIRTAMDRGGGVFSGPDGTFALESDVVARMAVHVLPVASGRPTIQTRFDPETWDTVEQGYMESFWPGNGEKNGVVPIDLAGRSEVDVGTIRVRSTPVYRLRAELPEKGCAEGETYYASLAGGAAPIVSTLTRGGGETIACGGELLVTGLRPGSYDLYLSPTDAPVSQQRFAKLSFDVTGENVERTILLQPGVTLEGRLELPSGMKFSGDHPFEGIGIQFTPTPWSGPAAMRRIRVDEDGSFRAENLPLGAIDIVVSGKLPESLAISGVTLHGLGQPQQIPANRTRIEWDGVGPLVFELGQNSGSISGTVKDGAGEPAHAMVIISAWPAPAGLRPEGRPVTDAKFVYSELPAGEYHLWALPELALLWMSQGGKLSDLGPGTAVKLKEGQSATVELRLPGQ